MEMNLETYKQELNRHDWLFYMSDDHRVYTAGNRDRDRLVKLAMSDEALKAAYNEKYLEVYSNEKVWGKVEAPLK